MVTANHQIRLAEAQDIPVIREIAEKSWLHTYPSLISNEQIFYMLDQIYSDKSLLHQMVKLEHHFALIEQAGQALGFASYSASRSKLDTLRLHKLYLRPEQHGHGLGRTIVEFVFSKALEFGFTQVELNVNRLNPTVNFYKKLGFEIISEENVPIGPYYMNDYVMLKKF